MAVAAQTEKAESSGEEGHVSQYWVLTAHGIQEPPRARDKPRPLRQPGSP